MKKIQWLILSIWFMSVPVLAQESSLGVRTQDAVAKVVFGSSIINFLVDRGKAHGTGFFVDQQTLVTNYHVIAPLLLFSFDNSDFEDLLESSYIEKDEQRYAITDIINVSVVDDLAVLQVEGYQGPVLELAEEETHLGDVISIPGFPSVDKIPEYTRTIRLQEITGTVVDITAYCSLADISLTIDFFSVLGGASGSPILNTAGKVVGVLHSTGGESIVCGTKIKHLKHLLQNPRFQSVGIYDFMESKIFEILDQTIKEKDTIAQYRLATLLLQDIIPETIVINHPFVDNNIHPKMLAVNFTKELAEQGNISAQFVLGNLYIEGLDVEEKKWFIMSETDSLVEQDIKQSIYWLEQVAEQGLPSAQYLLGKLYQVHSDFITSSSLFQQAAEQGYVPAQFELYSLDSCDVEIATENEIDVINKEQEYNDCMQRWKKNLEDLAERGYPAAQYKIGHFYRRNHDIHTAIKWYERAAEQGYEDGQLELGEIYYYGYSRADMINTYNRESDNIREEEAPVIDEILIEKDEEKAFYWLHRLIVQNQREVYDPNLTRLALESTERDTVYKTAIKSVLRGMTHVGEWFADIAVGESDILVEGENDGENIASKVDQ